MTATETKLTITREACDLRHRALIALINSLAQSKPEVHHRIAAHFRAITDGRHGNIATYHIAASIPLETKYEEYARISSALGLTRDGAGKPRIGQLDWSKLQGSIGVGHKAAEPDAIVERPVAEPLIEHPPTGRADPLTDTPAVADEDEAPEPAVTPRTRNHRDELEGDPDDLATLIARAIESKLHRQQSPPPAPVLDDGVIRLLCQEEIGKLDIAKHVAKANLNGAFPEDRVAKLIADAMANMVRRVELIAPSGDTKPITGLVHQQFDTILKMTSSRTASGHPVPVWLDGPPGGGKSHLMEQIGEALELQAHILAIGPTDTKSAVVGSVATGDFRPGIAYEPYKNGGVLGIDEIAAGDPGVLVSTNALVANQSYRFPNGELVKKHKNFHIIVADNTRGHGNVKGMIRNRLDAATLDRFAFLKVNYDEQLESALCGNAKWAAYVKQVREYIASNSGESVYITPRASINGAALLAGGLPAADVSDMTLFRFCSPDLKAAIITSVGAYQV